MAGIILPAISTLMSADVIKVQEGDLHTLDIKL